MTQDFAPESLPHIGVLAIQGDYEAHAQALMECGAQPSLVRGPADLWHLDGQTPDGQLLDGLILPGGESTTMLRFLDRGDGGENFFDVLKSFVRQRPVFGTCAGAILLAKDVRNPVQKSLAVLDIAVERNAYGVQRDSAILLLPTTVEDSQGGGDLETVFIRAPRIVHSGPAVETLALRDGFPVLIRQNNILAATFHPELSADRRVHRLFVEIVKADMKSKTRNAGA